MVRVGRPEGSRYRSIASLVSSGPTTCSAALTSRNTSAIRTSDLYGRI